MIGWIKKTWAEAKRKAVEAQYEKYLAKIEKIGKDSPMLGFPLMMWIETKVKPKWNETHDLKTVMATVDEFFVDFEKRTHGLKALMAGAAAQKEKTGVDDPLLERKMEATLLGTNVETILEADRQIAYRSAIERRADFVDKYCREKGWDKDNVTMDQVMEIRKQDEWIKAGQ